VLQHFAVVDTGDASELGFEMCDRAQVRLGVIEIIEGAAEESKELGLVMVAFGAKFDQFHEIGGRLRPQISSANASERISQSQLSQGMQV